MAATINADGLALKYGTDRATVGRGGEYVTVGATRELELKLTLTDLTEAETILSDAAVLPAGARIQEVEIVTNTAAATGVAIDVGLIRQDRTTEIDYDGLLAAFPTASMNAAGEKVVISDNTTYDGALVGTTLVYPSYISASRTTATAFTAGSVYLRIRYYVIA